MAHRCGATGRSDSTPGCPTAPASHDTLRKTELLLLAEALYPSITTYLLITRTIYLLVRSESLGVCGRVRSKLRSGEECQSESRSKKEKNRGKKEVNRLATSMS